MSEFKNNLLAVALKVKSDNCEYLTKKDRQTDTWQRDQNNVQQFKQNIKKFCKGLTYRLSTLPWWKSRKKVGDSDMK